MFTCSDIEFFDIISKNTFERITVLCCHCIDSSRHSKVLGSETSMQHQFKNGKNSHLALLDLKKVLNTALECKKNSQTKKKTE